MLICLARALSHPSSSCLAAGAQFLDGVVKLVGDTEQAVAVSSEIARVLGSGCGARTGRGFALLTSSCLALKCVCVSNWYLLGGMSGRRVAMPRGLPSLRWSTEPKRRKIFVVAGVEEASCSSTSAPSVSQPTLLGRKLSLNCLFAGRNNN